MLDNQLLVQLKEQLHNNKQRVEGIVKAHPNGYGFLEVKKKQTYFITPSNMKKVLHGDKISAYLETIKGKQQVVPETLISSSVDGIFVARVVLVKNKKGNTNIYIRLENEYFKQIIPSRINVKLDHPLKENDYVLAKLVSHPLVNEKFFVASIEEFICHANDNYSPWLVTFAKYGINRDKDVFEQSQSQPQIIDGYPRVDLTELKFFTIDSANSRDLDDALYLYPIYQDTQLQGWHLKVAIADPTAYIADNSDLDLLCQQNLVSTYYHLFSFSMLPKIFSENICSLLPNQPKAAIVCNIDLNLNGELQGEPTFQLATIVSKAKLNYEAVAEFIQTTEQNKPDSNSTTWDDEIKQQLVYLYQLSQIRYKLRSKDLCFNQNEYEYNINFDKGKINEINQRKTLISNSMVEEAMILANICATKLLAQQQQAIFNTHMGFDKKFIKLALTLLKQQQLDITDEQLTNVEGFKQLWQQVISIEDKRQQLYVEARLRRYIAPAEFKLQALPHFALGLPAYATWTSPIRKYSDMLNHRIIKSILHQQQQPLAPVDLIDRLTETRRKVRMIDSEITDWLYAEYMDTKLAQEYEGKIIDINYTHIKVQLILNGAWVYIPLKTLANTDKLKVNLQEIVVYQNNTILYRLTDILHVKITNVNLLTKQVYARIV